MPLGWLGSGAVAAAGGSGRPPNPDGRMPLIEHIRELRSRVLKILLALTVGSIIGWIFFGPVWKFIERPYCKIRIHGRPAGALYGSKGCTLFVTGIFDSFFLHLKIAIVVGILISSPVWLYQLWAFVAQVFTGANGGGPICSWAPRCRCSRLARASPTWR